MPEAADFTAFDQLWYPLTMAKPRGVDARLARLRALQNEPASAQFAAELRKALADSSNLVVAEAAGIAGDRNFADLAGDLVTAFHRFMEAPAEQDKQCRAKISLVQALNKLDYSKADVFLRGLCHVQMEGVWGGEQDTAAPLRGHAAFGLVRIGHPDVLVLLADLLADPEKLARDAAAQALGATGSSAAIPLLRFKARTGDQEPDVIGACFAALIDLDPKASIPFVAEFLEEGDQGVREAAALALGESRRPEALDVLKAFRERLSPGQLQEVVLLAIAMLRLPAAVDLLVEIVSKEDQATAKSALSALAIHRHNPKIVERVAAILTSRNDAVLQAFFQKKFRDMEPK